MLIFYHIVTQRILIVPDGDGCQVAAPGLEMPLPLRVSGHHGVLLPLLLCLRASTGDQTYCTFQIAATAVI